MRNRQTRFIFRFVMALAAVGALLAFGAWPSASAADKQPAANPRPAGQPGQAAPAGAAPAKANAAAAQTDSADDDDNADAPAEDPATRYKVPDTKDPADLIKFMQKMQNYRPESIEDAVEHQKRAPLAVKTAAERILKIEKDEASEAYKTASLMLLALRISAIDEAKPAEQHAIIGDLIKRLSAAEPSREDYGLAMLAARKFDTLDDTKLAAEGYNALAKMFKKSKEKQIADLGATFEGAARRIDLVGKPMKVEGQPIGGKPFDWKSYRGKVVLVDFWATWCGPCKAELPNVRRAYQEYHNRGFDVVGVSIDDETDKLKEFVAEESLPWVTLHDVSPHGEEGSHPLAEYYGIMGIPTVILVGKDGNVVTLSARGDELWDQLDKLIGPPTKAKAAADVPAATAKPAVGSKPKPAGK